MNYKKSITVLDIFYEDISDFLVVDFPIFNIGDCFQYHPPKTQERKDAHQSVGDISKLFYDEFIINDSHHIDYHYWSGRWDIINRAIDFAVCICKEPICLQWAIKSIIDISSQPNSILMTIQQYRMFLNQGITISSL
jgi:hypothetical protein